ncbi:hypothetical protein BDF19DRAFT_324766 [Syncephalis fuscata]|nr:hypothetical protein BDF19DRAFT_324766 [Syncephalis fuscata]
MLLHVYYFIIYTLLFSQYTKPKMPFINYTDPTQTEWRHNSTKQWGIPLHPFGEISVPDFLMDASGHIDEQRLRLIGVQLQMIFSVTMLCIFVHNIVITTKMTISRPRSMFSWCCLRLLLLNAGMVSRVFYFTRNDL